MGHRRAVFAISKTQLLLIADAKVIDILYSTNIFGSFLYIFSRRHQKSLIVNTFTFRANETHLQGKQSDPKAAYFAVF